jgi:hypothetical protein
MTNELLEEMLHSAPLSWGISPVKSCNCKKDESCPFCSDEVVIPICDLENPESCESCQ